MYVQSMLRNTPEERRYHLRCGRSQELSMQCLMLVTAMIFVCFTDRKWRAPGIEHNHNFKIGTTNRFTLIVLIYIK
jgi:hypothetical protein